MMRSIEVVVQGVRAPRWRARLRSFCEHVLHEAGAEQWDLSFLLCDDERMRQLNNRYRGKDRPTDVLSFSRETTFFDATLREVPSGKMSSRGPARKPRSGKISGAPVAGDIAISLDTMRRNALDFEVSEDEELKRLVVHGILHCAGMDHSTGKGGRMLALQERLLDALKEVRIIAK